VTAEAQVLKVARERDQVFLELHLPTDLVFFQGHFRGCPILPGIVQIAWAIEYARRYLKLQGRCVGMKSVKFSRAIQPQMPVTLTATLTADGAQLHFAYRSQTSDCSSGVLLIA
jgi:3-hydroxymyristoyl/3-hydroxydecanoyl-(acyl carrier protein) dehydratase